MSMSVISSSCISVILNIASQDILGDVNNDVDQNSFFPGSFYQLSDTKTLATTGGMLSLNKIY